MLKKLDNFIEKTTIVLLLISLSAIIFYSVLEIILRQFQVTYLWIGSLVRHLVFLCSFLGAALATGSDKHIKIDIISKIVKPESRAYLFIDSLVLLVTTLVCIWLSSAAFDFFQSEMKYGKEIFWGLHSSYLTFIIPFGFVLISFRFFYQWSKQVRKLL